MTSTEALLQSIRCTIAGLTDYLVISELCETGGGSKKTLLDPRTGKYKVYYILPDGTYTQEDTGLVYSKCTSGSTGGGSSIDYTTLLVAIRDFLNSIDSDTNNLEPILESVDNLETLLNTSNTLSNAIKTAVDSILTNVNQINLNTDGLEASLTAITAVLNTLSTNTSDIKDLLLQSNIKLDTINSTILSKKDYELINVYYQVNYLGIAKTIEINSLKFLEYIYEVKKDEISYFIRSDVQYNDLLSATEPSGYYKAVIVGQTDTIKSFDEITSIQFLNNTSDNNFGIFDNRITFEAFSILSVQVISKVGYITLTKTYTDGNTQKYRITNEDFVDVYGRELIGYKIELGEPSTDWVGEIVIVKPLIN